jgi:NTE family protein
MRSHQRDSSTTAVDQSRRVSGEARRIKRALVVSGGGSKGAFAIGAIQYMVEELHLDFNIVSGTSTGAVIATLVVAGEHGLLKKIYTSIHTEDVLKKNNPLKIACGRVPSWYSTKPLEHLIDRDLTLDIARKVLDSRKQMFLTTVCLQTGAIVYFQTGPGGSSEEPTTEVVHIDDREHLIQAILASTNQPVLMPPVVVDSHPLAQYVDGGVRAYAPIQIAADNGADEIYAVVLSPEPAAREPKGVEFTQIVKILARTIDLLTEQVGECSLRLRQRDHQFMRFLDALKDELMRRPDVTPQEVNELFDSALNPVRGMRAVTLHLVRPRRDLPTDGLEFDPDIMKQMIKMGWDEAKRVLGVRH